MCTSLFLYGLLKIKFLTMATLVWKSILCWNYSLAHEKLPNQIKKVIISTFLPGCIYIVIFFNLELGVALIFNLLCWTIFSKNNILIYSSFKTNLFSSSYLKLSSLLCGGTVCSKLIARGSLRLPITVIGKETAGFFLCVSRIVQVLTVLSLTYFSMYLQASRFSSWIRMF